MTALAPTLQAFFTDRLITQRQASPHTVAAYRDALRLLLVFASARRGKQPSQLDIADLDAPLIGAFLNHLETRPRQQRAHPQRPADRDPLAVRLRRAAPSRARRAHRPGAGHPGQALRPGTGLASSPRTRSRRSSPAADRSPWTGRRDHALLLTGSPDRAARLRAHRPHLPGHPPGHRPARPLPRQGPEAADHPAHPATVTVRCAPGWPNAAASPATRCSPPGAAARSAATRCNAASTKYTSLAARRCPSLRSKTSTPHMLRHYVDGWVMWPAAASPLVAEPRVLVPAT